MTLAGWGFLFGGLGFVIGDFANMLGRAQWGPIGRYEALQGLDYWKWMEQLFGLVTGLGVGAVFLRRLRDKLAPPAEDARVRSLDVAALLFLLIVMMWLNLLKNVRTWARWVTIVFLIAAAVATVLYSFSPLQTTLTVVLAALFVIDLLVDPTVANAFRPAT